MNPKLVEKAHSRLRLATRALDDLRSAKSHQEFSDLWYGFLTAAKNVYTALEQGAKDNPRCRQWYGGIKAVRKADPLLQYLFQARDDEEHGIDVATELLPGSLGLGVTKPGFSNNISIRSFTIDNGRVSFDATSNDGKPILIETTPSRTILKPVTGRGGIIYDPPTSHLGRPLTDNGTIPVAEAAIDYLRSIVLEAERRA